MRSSNSELALLALRYARGQLPPSEAAAFEQRLGEDQAAREAVAGAAVVAQACQTGTPAQPHPRYRMAVRRRLKDAARPRLLVWAGIGALTVVLFAAPLWWYLDARMTSANAPGATVTVTSGPQNPSGEQNGPDGTRRKSRRAEHRAAHPPSRYFARTPEDGQPNRPKPSNPLDDPMP